GNGLAIQAPRLLGEPGDEAGRIGDFAARFGQWLALLPTEDARQRFLVLQEQFAPAPQQSCPRLQALLAPRHEGTLRGIHRGDDLFMLEQRYMVDDLAVGRVEHGDAVATVAVQPLAVDV